MLKALFKKKRQEFQAKGMVALLPLLLIVSLAPLLGLLFDTPAAVFFSHAPVVLLGGLLGLLCAGAAFEGEFANQANRFLEYLPVRRSSVWLAGYLSGLALLCLGAISLLWLELLLYPWGIDPQVYWQGAPFEPPLAYLVPDRFALAVSCGSILFWAYSIAVFPAAYLEKQDVRPTGTPVLMVLGALALPIGVVVTLSLLGVLPSGLAISPVLLTSAALLTAGSYALFALVPKHLTQAKRGLLGLVVFLSIFGVLVGQLYQKHLAWRALDPSLPLRVTDVYRPELAGHPDLVLADVRSWRSGEHCVSLDVEQGAYHDLGRGLSFVEVPEEQGGLLHFLRFAYPAMRRSDASFVSMAPDATGRTSFAVPHDRWLHTGGVRWLPDRRILVYSAWLKDGGGHCLCVADSTGTLLRRFKIGSGATFLLNAAGQALAVGPQETRGDGKAGETSEKAEKPYMMFDLESGSIDRFALPGNVLYFAKDLSRAICWRARVQEGRQYKSYFVVDVPSLEERLILPEAEFPPVELTAPVDVRAKAGLATDDDDPEPFLRVNDAFDRALWVKQRVEEDYFRNSIVLVDLDTAEQRVVVPESAIPKRPVVSGEGSFTSAVHLLKFTADRAGFIYTIGQRTYLRDIDGQESILLADQSIIVEGSDKGSELATFRQPRSPIDYSPSGRRVLRCANVWEHSQDAPPQTRLKFAAIEVFEEGKPVRLYTGQRPLTDALWLDDERIVFYEGEAIYLLQASGGPPRQIFPPVGQTGD